jgi:hypothetical protein
MYSFWGGTKQDLNHVIYKVYYIKFTLEKLYREIIMIILSADSYDQKLGRKYHIKKVSWWVVYTKNYSERVRKSFGDKFCPKNVHKNVGIIL